MMTQEEWDAKRQPCEIWQRIVGYIRMREDSNPGKQEEIKDRKMFKVHEIV